MIARLLRFIFRRPASQPEEVRPNRAARRLALRMKPGERQQKYLEGALRKAARKKARGYRAAHVRTREVYTAGVNRGIEMTLAAMTKRLKNNDQRRRWLPRIVSRMPRAA